MRIRPIHAALAAFLAAFAAFALALPPALAFTVENKDADGPYTVPKFNLEEQSRQFRKDNANSLAPVLGKTDFSTPLGTGSLYFGTSPFSSSSGSTFGSAQNYRSHFERVVTPENLR